MFCVDQEPSQTLQYINKYKCKSQIFLQVNHLYIYVSVDVVTLA